MFNRFPPDILFRLLYRTRDDVNLPSIYSRFCGITVPEDRCSPEIDSKFAPRADRPTRHSKFDSIVTDTSAVVTFNSHSYLWSKIETSSFDCSNRIWNSIQLTDDEWDELDYNHLTINDSYVYIYVYIFIMNCINEIVIPKPKLLYMI